MKSEAAVAQSDIQTFYDSLAMLRICRWLAQKGMQPSHVACLLRHQMLPAVWLHTGDSSVLVQNRSIGGLTGSMLAGAFGRIPVESTISKRASHWSSWGFALSEGVSLTMATYVDNLFSCSTTVSGALSILEDAEKELYGYWGHKIKQSSRSVMPCKDSIGQTHDLTRWPVVSSFKCLGHILSNDASIRPCFKATRRGMWKAFWANCGHSSFRAAPVQVKLDLLNRSCAPLLSYRCSRWPPQRRVAQELDQLQGKMVSILLRMPRRPGEAINEYCRRRNREAAKKCKKVGLWSLHWFKRAVAWDRHIQRGHNPFSWPSLLHEFHDASWLEHQRHCQNLRGTGTRVSAGRPHARWNEGIAFASRRLQQP